MRLGAKLLLGALLAAVTIFPAAAASPPFPLGPDFLIGGFPVDSYRPSIGANADGVAVVVWTSSGKNVNYVRIYARIYGADGAPAGDPIVVAESPVGPIRLDHPSVALAADGSFVVGWLGADSAAEGFLARRFAADGTPLGAAFVVNQAETGGQVTPRLAAVPGGGFVAVWAAAAGGAIYGRLFDAGGQPLTGDITVATSSSRLAFPDIEHLGGGYAATWQRGSGSSVGIVARRLDASLVPVGEEHSALAELSPLVAGAQDGGGPFFAVVSYSPSSGVVLRRFDQDGQVGGGENVSDGLPRQFSPSLDFDLDGNLVVAWVDNSAPGSLVLRGRLLDGRPPLGAPSASIVINTTGDTVLGPTAIAAIPDGRVFVAWTDDGLRGRFLSSTLIFADGFESGDTAAWQ